MSTARTTWTDQQLELFHDGELPPQQREQLVADLRHDPALRQRLGQIVALDTHMRAAIESLDSPSVETPAVPSAGADTPRRRSALRLPLMLAAAAAVVVAAVGVWRFVRPAPASRGEVAVVVRPANIAPPSDPPQRAVERPYRPIRVVWSRPSSSGEKPRTLRREKKTAAAAKAAQLTANQAESAARVADAQFLRRLDALLAAGQPNQVLAALDTAAPARRQMALTRIGDTLRSAYVAEQVLDRLSPREQLAVCRSAVRDESLRPVMFRRLRSLAQRNDLGPDMARTISELASDKTLRPWLRSYKLTGLPQPGRS